MAVADGRAAGPSRLPKIVSVVAFLQKARIGRLVLVLLLTAFLTNDAVRSTSGLERVALCVLLPVCGVVLLIRRLPWQAAPLLVFGVAAALGAGGTLPLVCVVLFDLAVEQRLRWAVGGFGGVLVVNSAFDTVDPNSWETYISLLIIAALVVLFGLWRGSRRRFVRLLADQVEHLKVEAELREEAARSTERARIAAEMHDVLAHRLSLIALHTGVLVTRGDDLPERVADRLRLLRSASTEALADLRDVLGALHTTENPVEPISGRLEPLVDQARAAGQQVELTIDGDPESVPTTHRLGVHRIVQEALTNIRKHAAGADATIRVGFRPPATTVEVTNTAGQPAPGVVSSGYGLIGLRERITTLGGTLDTGPIGTGAWRVSATIPHPSDSTQNRLTA